MLKRQGGVYFLGQRNPEKSKGKGYSARRLNISADRMSTNQKNGQANCPFIFSPVKDKKDVGRLLR